MNALHTPGHSFADLADISFAPKFLVGDDINGGGLCLWAETPDLFARIVVANTALPTGGRPM